MAAVRYEYAPRFDADQAVDAGARQIGRVISREPR
jgi:hypothetical protein